MGKPHNALGVRSQFSKVAPPGLDPIIRREYYLEAKHIDTIDIAAPPDRVFRWITEPELGKRWSTSITGGEFMPEVCRRSRCRILNF